MPTAPGLAPGQPGAVRGGDQNALNLLLDAYRPYLAAISCDQLPFELTPEAKADDAAQEPPTRSWAGLPPFRGRTAEEFADWLRAVLCGDGPVEGRADRASRP